MRSSKVIHVVSCHAEGEVGDVIVGGVAPPPGTTLWEQSRWIARDQELRNFVLNEPRGGVFRHVNLLVPAKDPRAQMAWIIMEPADTPPMSGSNSLCVSTVLLDSGILPMSEPETRLVLEAPGGLIEAVAQCRDGKVQRVEVKNVPSFADKRDAMIEVEGLGSLKVDTAYGGDSFVIADARTLGFALTADEAADLGEFEFADLVPAIGNQLDIAFARRAKRTDDQRVVLQRAHRRIDGGRQSHGRAVDAGLDAGDHVLFPVQPAQLPQAQRNQDGAAQNADDQREDVSFHR